MVHIETRIPLTRTTGSQLHWSWPFPVEWRVYILPRVYIRWSWPIHVHLPSKQRIPMPANTQHSQTLGPAWLSISEGENPMAICNSEGALHVSELALRVVGAVNLQVRNNPRTMQPSPKSTNFCKTSLRSSLLMSCLFAVFVWYCNQLQSRVITHLVSKAWMSLEESILPRTNDCACATNTVAGQNM